MFHVKRLLFSAFFAPIISFAQVGTTTLPTTGIPDLPAKDLVVVNFNAQYAEIDKMSQVKQEWFYWTNYSRINPKRFYDSVVGPLVKAMPALKNSYSVSLKSDLYKAPSLPMVKPSKNLEKVAQTFASEMAQANASPSHNSPSGSTFQSRMESIQIKYCAGENISFGPAHTALMLVLLYIDEGVSNLGHRKTLLDPTFTEMGIGYDDYTDGKHIVVQDFSCNQTP